MEPSLTVQVRVPSRYPPERVTWSRVMVTSPLVSEPLEVRVTPSDPLVTGPFGSGSLPPPLLLGVAVLLPLGVVPPVGVRVISTRRLAARASSVVSLTLGSDSPLPETVVFHLSSLVSCSSLVLTALARFSDLTRDSLVGFRWLGVSFRWYCGVGGLVVGH